jgi:hypothetical protein
VRIRGGRGLGHADQQMGGKVVIPAKAGIQGGVESQESRAANADVTRELFFRRRLARQ